MTANKLKRLMTLHGITTQQLANATGYKRITVTKWRCGDRPITARAEKLICLALAAWQKAKGKPA